MDRAATVAALAEAIQAIAQGDMGRGADIVVQLASKLSGSQGSLPGIPAPQAKVSSTQARKEAARRVFDYWRTECQHPRAKPTPERIQCVMARLRQGYSESEILRAVDGAAASPTTNDAGKRYDDLTLICRNGSKLEDFMARGEKACGPVVEPGPVDGVRALRRAAAAAQRRGDEAEYKSLAERLRKAEAGG